MMDLKRSIIIEIDAKGAVVGSKRVQDALRDIETTGKRHMGTLKREIDSSARSMDMLGNAAKVAAGFFSAQAMIQFGRAVLDAGIAMDSLRRSFVAITGTQYGAASELEFLRATADKLGLSFYDLAPAFKSIAASARGTALEGESVRKIFVSIASAAAALGMSTSDTEGALRALGQMISKGTVQAEELRGQLGERLPGAFQLAAKAMGVTTAQLGKMLENGDVLATDLLPKLAEEIQNMYGAAAQTAALESAQAAVNRLSQEWTDLKINLFSSDAAVGGINAITEALRGMNAMIDNVQQGKVYWIWDGLQMPDQSQNTFRGKVNRNDVRTAPEPVVEDNRGVQTAAQKNKAEREAKAREKAYKQMIEDGKKAEEAITKYGEEYEQRRIDAIAEGVEARKEATAEELQLQAEFAEKYKESVLGETAFKMAQIDAQGAAYRKAGADEVAVAQYVAAEKLKYSREWQDGVKRGLEDYADSATDAAAQAENAIVGGFRNMEDALVDFITTGKLEFSDLADSIISDLARIAVQQSITGPLASALGGFDFSSLFGGGSVGPKVGYAKGGIPGAASLHAYANSIVSSPTVFPFAKGVGLMGEAGPEAIMPLKRGADGTLGVQGGGSNVVVNVIESPGNGGQQNRRNEGGTTIIDVMVEQIEAKIAGNMARRQGPLYNANRSVFGLSGQPGAY